MTIDFKTKKADTRKQPKSKGNSQREQPAKTEGERSPSAPVLSRGKAKSAARSSVHKSSVAFWVFGFPVGFSLVIFLIWVIFHMLLILHSSAVPDHSKSFEKDIHSERNMRVYGN
jgi:hypothetical protein